MKLFTQNGPSFPRLLGVFVFFIVMAGSIIVRASLIQVKGDDRLAAMAKRQFQSKVLLSPKRGVIADRYGEPLAVNMEATSLAVNPSKVVNKKTMARLLVKALDLNYAKTLQKLKLQKEFSWIKRDLTEEDLSRLKKWNIIFPDGVMAEGFWTIKESKRIYPHRELASHLLGSVNLDNEGLEGTELWFEAALKGQIASVKAVKDAYGRPAFMDAAAAQHLKDGKDVQLTIDASLQYSVEQELRFYVQKASAQSGSVVVMNAETGEVLAMANEPSFDPNIRNSPSSKRRNRVLTDGFEPGSTIKPLLLAAALSPFQNTNGIRTAPMKLDDLIYGEKGKFIVQGKKISEAEAHEKFEWISLKKVIAVSSNVGAAKLALKVGPEKYFHFLNGFGLGVKSGLGFPGEIQGRIPDYKKWSPLTLANIGFGQGLLVTPIQMAKVYAIIANGGWDVEPKIIKNADELLKKDNQLNAVKKRLLSEQAVQQVTEALLAVTEPKGTGLKANVSGFRIAGKTGTAQVVDPKTKAYSRNHYIASFAGFPIPNKETDPKIVIFTMINEPKGIYYASETAAPLFAAVMEAVASRLSLTGNRSFLTDNNQLDSNGSPLGSKELLGHQKLTEENEFRASPPAPLIGNDTIVISQAQKKGNVGEIEGELKWHSFLKNGVVQWSVPSFKGMSLQEAYQLLGEHDFDLEVQGFGVVKNQEPSVGQPITEGSKIKLTLSDPE